MKSLQNKRALITGGARGIGLSIARAFAAAGAEIVLTDIDEEKLDETRSSLTAAGAECHAYVLDVTDDSAIAAARDRLHEEVGRIDLLVNNAGISSGGECARMSLDDWRFVLQVNLF
ncbi:MAG: SDR family NAD(P)-dependent oxidoreductase, partial [Thermoanaerobaculia bacterium]